MGKETVEEINAVDTSYSSNLHLLYEGVSKIFRTDAVKIINLTTKLPTSTHLHATWHTDWLNMVVLPSTGASRYHNCCIDGATIPESFGYTLVWKWSLDSKVHKGNAVGAGETNE
jgi:hypothetical protein